MVTALIIGSTSVSCGLDGPPAFSPSGVSRPPAASEVHSPSPAGSLDDPVLAELRARPSLLGEIVTDQSCPVSLPLRVQGTALRALGAEPLYATGIDPVTDWDAMAERGESRRLEVTWLRLPVQRLPVLIRGVNLDDETSLDFQLTGSESSKELYLTTETSTEAETIGPDYRMWTTLMEIAEPGCYGRQVEGIGHFGGYTIVIEIV